jgi:hypothetical protein
MPASSSASSAAAALTTTATTDAPNNNDKTNNDTSSVKQQQRCIGTIAKPPLRSAAVTKRELVLLRALRHAHAASVERQARIVALAVRELVELHERMDRKARAISGDDYEVRHTVSFERHGSMHEQRENLGEVLIPGLIDVAAMVQDMADDAQEVAEEDAPPALPSEFVAPS